MAVSMAFGFSLAQWLRMCDRSSRLLACVAALFLAMLPMRSARADVDVRAASLQLPGVALQQVHLQLAGDGSAPLKMQLTAARARLPALGWRRVALQWQGTVRRVGAERWVLDGAMRLKHAPGGLLANGHLRLLIDVNANTLEVDISQGAGTVRAALPLDQPTHAQIRLQKAPLRWLQGVLVQAWPGGRLQAGRVSGQFGLDMLDQGIRSSGQFAISNGGFDSSAGTLAGQGIALSGRLRVDTSGATNRIDLDGAFRGGDVLLGPIYASLPRHLVRLSVSARSAGKGIRLRNLRFADADALKLAGSVDLSADGAVRRLALSRVQATFPQVYKRYGKSWLSNLGIQNLRASGSIEGHLDLGADGPQSFAFRTDDLDLADGSGRFAVTDLHGALDWNRRGSRPATTLAWKQARFYRIVNGATRSHWQSRDGTLRLQQPLRIPMLNGALTLPKLAWNPAASRGQRLDTSMVLTDISVPALCKAFGWPAFKGRLGGAIPGLRYADDRFELDGGLSLNVFNGFVDVTRLSVQNPFGNTPVLAADMSMRDLDLGAITSVFDFGRITGRMHGSVDNLRLVNWKPVAFDAQLLADAGGRISQRAVNNLTAVGGGGMAAGLQGAVLKLFDSFGYSRIGLRCQLKGSVCRMSGLGAQDGGYAIVEGRGLPHLNVIGHETRVSWPTLVSRLKAAIEGGGPVVK
jgi:hypothetical protein